MKTPDEFFNEYCMASGRAANAGYAACFHFDLTKETADRLAAMTAEGKKRGSSASKLAYLIKGEPLPKAGDLWIITDFSGEPRCIVELTRVTELPFSDMSEDICSRECDGMTLEAWREAHTAFFTAQGKALGYAFTDDMPVLFEDFRVVHT